MFLYKKFIIPHKHSINKFKIRCLCINKKPPCNEDGFTI